jgi:hypothetical protein
MEKGQMGRQHYRGVNQTRRQSMGEEMGKNMIKYRWQRADEKRRSIIERCYNHNIPVH